jgi:hypothetical protein
LESRIARFLQLCISPRNTQSTSPTSEKKDALPIVRSPPNFISAHYCSFDDSQQPYLAHLARIPAVIAYLTPILATSQPQIATKTIAGADKIATIAMTSEDAPVMPVVFCRHLHDVTKCGGLSQNSPIRCPCD